MNKNIELVKSCGLNEKRALSLLHSVQLNLSLIYKNRNITAHRLIIGLTWLSGWQISHVCSRKHQPSWTRRFSLPSECRTEDGEFSRFTQRGSLWPGNEQLKHIGHYRRYRSGSCVVCVVHLCGKLGCSWQSSHLFLGNPWVSVSLSSSCVTTSDMTQLWAPAGGATRKSCFLIKQTTHK